MLGTLQVVYLLGLCLVLFLRNVRRAHTLVEYFSARLLQEMKLSDEIKAVFRADTYKQVVWHTPVEKIFEKDGIISTDVFSTYRDGTQIGESARIAIDSKSGGFEKIEVMGKLGV